MKTMNRAFRAPFLVIVVACLVASACSYLPLRLGGRADQPFARALREVMRQPADQREALLDDLVRDRAMPACEGERCYFLYKGQPNHRVSVAGDWNGWKPRADNLKRVKGTSYYLLVKEFPSDARLDYKIVDDGRWLLDPLNPRICEGGMGPNSELAMPAYKDPEELKPHPDIRHGVVEEFTFESAILSGTRTVSVYLPPGYGRVSTSHPFLIVHDGADYVRLARSPDVADLLIVEKRIRPVVLVFVDPQNRGEDYGRSETYLQFTAEELIPYLRSTYDLSPNAEDCGVLGASLGGFVAFRLAWKYPEIFGKVAGQSTYFGKDDTLFDAVRGAAPKPIRLYLDVGRFERLGSVNLLRQNQKMRDLLVSKGYELTYAEYNEGHSWGSWRAHLDDILISFWPRVRV